MGLTRLERRCSFRLNKWVCSRSCCRHGHLRGQTEQGKFWTEIAEAHPRPFARAFASCHREAIAAILAQGFIRCVSGPDATASVANFWRSAKLGNSLGPLPEAGPTSRMAMQAATEVPDRKGLALPRS